MTHLSDLKIIVLTNNGSLYGKKILNHLRARALAVQAAVVIRQPLTYFLRLFQFIHRRVGTVDSLYFTMRRLAFERDSAYLTHWQGRPFVAYYDQLGVPVYHSRQTNSPQTQQIVAALAPDVMILGQTGIVRAPLLQIPRLGALNAHPGILPFYRGIDCAKWAAHRGEFDKIGSTVHWVDPGVDTGRIVRAERYAFIGNEALDTLDDHLYDQCALMLGDVLAGLRRGEPQPGIAQDRAQGTQYYKMSRKDEEIARAQLAQFLQTQ